MLFRSVFSIVALVAATVAFPAPARADSVITVATGVDEQTSNGLCSLREAITNANNNAHTATDCVAGTTNDAIVFAGTVTTITLGAALPSISDAAGLTIDGANHVTISGNHSVGLFVVAGGGALLLRNLALVNGSSSSGAAISNSGVLTVEHSSFSGNSVTNSGGAIINGGTASIRGSTFVHNAATNDGGAIDDFGGALTISNSTFANNSANYGGGVQNNNGTVYLFNSTFSANSAATNGGALGTWNGGTAPITMVRNTILANSPAGDDCWNGLGSNPLSGGNNIIETTSNCTSIATITSDPGLTALSGSPAYYGLSGSSPAISAGSDAVCAASPVFNASQNAIPRPQGAHCEIGSFEMPLTSVLRSTGANDGWVLETAETSNAGGTLNATAGTFNLGDDAANRQYRAILHFNTFALPDTAVVTKATLMIKQQGLVGSDPFATHGVLRVDTRKPYFGAAGPLEPGDFQAAAGASGVGRFGVSASAGWYRAPLSATGKSLINLVGTTEYRLRFALDDNNDHGADYVRFFSGNAPTAANRPQLTIEYYVP